VTQWTSFLDFSIFRKSERLNAIAEIWSSVSEDFINVLLAARVAGLGPYKYSFHFSETIPDHLHPKDEELVALGTNGVGQLKGPALKAMRKVNQIFRDRRQLAMHLFYVPSQNYWHLFYFDQRDYQQNKNHWKHGSHIHFSKHIYQGATGTGLVTCYRREAKLSTINPCLLRLPSQPVLESQRA
jgi:hypothetical protein